MTLARSSAPRAAKILAAFALAPLLAGCVETVAELSAADAPHAGIIRASGLSPRPAAVAFTGVEGAPEQVSARFSQIFMAEAVKRDVALADAASARYLVRGYLSTFPSDGGATITYVWDVYDRDKHRAQRLNDETSVRGDGADPWSLVNDQVIAVLATRSANDVAAFLSNTPEAMAARQQESAPPPTQANQTETAAPPAATEPAPRAALSYADTQ